MSTQTLNKPQDVVESVQKFAAIKAKQQTVWASGDYSRIGSTLQIVGEQLCETINLATGSKVLDVAAGNGNATIAAARRFCDVTSTDYVQELLNQSQKRANAHGMDVKFQVADAEALPFGDESFDAVLSTFGVMFTPNQARAAQELARVCKTGGIIGLANWTADGFIGQVFKTLGKHVPPAPGLQSPARWGNEEDLAEMFGDQVSTIETTERMFNFRYHSFEHFMDIFVTYYGPIHMAFKGLGERANALAADLEDLSKDFNIAKDGSFVVPSKYVDAKIIK